MTILQYNYLLCMQKITSPQVIHDKIAKDKSQHVHLYSAAQHKRHVTESLFKENTINIMVSTKG